MIYSFWLSDWYLLTIVLSVLLWFTASDYLTDWYLLTIVLSVFLWFTASDYLISIFWPLYCLFFFDLRFLIISLVSFDHCIVCSSVIYGFWLSHWYLLTIVLSVLLWFTTSDYLICFFWPLCCLFFFDLWLLMISLVSFDHCIVCSSVIYSFWLSDWYLLTIVLSVLLWFTASDYLIEVSFDHCIVCSSVIYSFWLSHWYVLTIVLSVLLWFTASDYLIGIFWPLYCLFFFDLLLLIISSVSFDHCIVCSSLIYGFWLSHWYLLTIVLSVLLWFMASDDLIGIFWPLYCLFFCDLQLMIIWLVSFDHCIVCSSLIYGFWLSNWGIFWPLYCLFFCDLQLLIISLVSFDHCIVCSSVIDGFWLSHWYLLTIVLSVLLWFTASDYLIGIFWPLYCLFYFDLQLLMISLVSFDHCIVCSSLIMASDYLIGIFWPLYCLFFFDWWLLIISLVSFDHCIVCSSLIYSLWLSHWYLLTIVLSVLWFTASDYLNGIFWPL